MIDPTDRITDPSDMATHQEQLALAASLIASRKPEGPVATGECLHCGETLPGDMRWCDASCRDSYQAEQAARARAGR